MTTSLLRFTRPRRVARAFSRGGMQSSTLRGRPPLTEASTLWEDQSPSSQANSHEFRGGYHNAATLELPTIEEEILCDVPIVVLDVLASPWRCREAGAANSTISDRDKNMRTTMRQHRANWIPHRAAARRPRRRPLGALPRRLDLLRRRREGHARPVGEESRAVGVGNGLARVESPPRAIDGAQRTTASLRQLGCVRRGRYIGGPVPKSAEPTIQPHRTQDCVEGKVNGARRLIRSDARGRRRRPTRFAGSMRHAEPVARPQARSEACVRSCMRAHLEPRTVLTHLSSSHRFPTDPKDERGSCGAASRLANPGQGPESERTKRYPKLAKPAGSTTKAYAVSPWPPAPLPKARARRGDRQHTLARGAHRTTAPSTRLRCKASCNGLTAPRARRPSAHQHTLSFDRAVQGPPEAATVL